MSESRVLERKKTSPCVGQVMSFYAYSELTIPSLLMVVDPLSDEPIPFVLILIVLCGSALSDIVSIFTRRRHTRAMSSSLSLWGGVTLE